MDVNAVRIHGPVTQANHATSREYIDLAGAAVRDGILGEGVRGALDTLKEIGDYLRDGSMALASSRLCRLNSAPTSVVLRRWKVDCITTSKQSEMHASKQYRACLICSIPKSWTVLKR